MTPNEMMARMGDALDEARETIAELEAEVSRLDSENDELREFADCAWQEIVKAGRSGIFLYDFLERKAGELGLK